MNGPSAISVGIGLGFCLGSFFIAYLAMKKRRFYRARLRSGLLDYWQRVFAREAMANATGDLMIAGFAFAMGGLLIGMGVSKILL